MQHLSDCGKKRGLKIFSDPSVFMMMVIKNHVVGALAPAARVAFSDKAQLVTLKVGCPIVQAGEQTSSVYFPETAVISAMAPTGEGRGVVMCHVGREAFAGEGAMLGQTRALYSSVVLVGGVAHAMKPEDLETLASQFPDLRRALLAAIQSILYRAKLSHACAGAHGAKQRLARLILTIADRTDGNHVPLTHQQMADLLVLRRATVTEAAREFQVAGLIDYKRGRVTITDRAGLTAESCDCYDLTTRVNAALLPPSDAED